MYSGRRSLIAEILNEFPSIFVQANHGTIKDIRLSKKVPLMAIDLNEVELVMMSYPFSNIIMVVPPDLDKLKKRLILEKYRPYGD